MANTILDYATQRREKAKQGVASAQSKLAQTQQLVATQRDELTQATQALGGLEKEADAIRQKLAVIPTSADGDTLLEALELTIIRTRGKQAAIVETGAALAAAQAEAEVAQAALTAASAKLTSAEADLKAAGQADKQRAKWKTALTSPPLSTISADADDVLKDALFTDAETRLKDDLTEKLFDRAKERRQDEDAKVTKAISDAQKAEDDRLKELDQHGGLAGSAEKLRVALLRLEAKAQDLINGAADRFTQAQILLARAADPTKFPLTPEQRARIDTADAALQTKRENAADQEQAPPADWLEKFDDLKAKFAIVAARQTALAQAIQKAAAAKKNPGTDPDVIKTKQDLQDAQDDLATAETDYRASDHGILHIWEAAVPDTLWQLLDDFEDAKAWLTELKGAAPAQLKSDLDQAEAAYVAAQLAADDSLDALMQLAAEQVRQAALRQIVLQTAGQRLFSAARGDN